MLVLQLAIGAGCALNSHGTAPHVTRGIDVSADFKRRVDQYMDLHAALRDQRLSPEQTVDLRQNDASQRALARRIRTARRTAHQGDIFTPAIAAMLRRALNPQLRGADAAGTRASIRDDAPARFPLRVNRAYPAGAPLPTVPPNVLLILPPLPEGLQYRIVDSHLILMDADADIVVDYVYNVMCARC